MKNFNLKAYGVEELVDIEINKVTGGCIRQVLYLLRNLNKLLV